MTPAPQRALAGFALGAAVLAFAYLLFFASAWVNRQWLVDSEGRPIPSDFVNVYAAGKLALAGRAVDAYSQATHEPVEDAAIGYDFGQYYIWPYPPTFLFPAALLALLPLIPATLVWMLATFPLYAAAVRGAVGSRVGWVLACGFPAVIWNLAVGQNGFLTAGLIGGTLVLLDRRPILAGVCLGILTYKPHLGILFPLALAIGGHWRAIASATVTTFVLAMAAGVAFGFDTWTAFAHSLGSTSSTVFTDGRADLAKQQTVLGFLRWLGVGVELAWAFHGLTMAACAAAVAFSWRHSEPEIRFATLGVGALLATPYLYIYDFPILAVPLGFLLRLGVRTGFRNFEVLGVVVAAGLVLLGPFVQLPLGLAANLVVAGMIARRCIDRLSDSGGAV